jgi:hypothetical protein
MMKRAIYILSFTFLGVLLQFLAHALLEMAIISLLLGDFERYSLGLSWSQWYAVHQTLSLVLLMLGIIFGYRWGIFWWQVIYVEERYRKWKWWPRIGAAKKDNGSAV